MGAKIVFAVLADRNNEAVTWLTEICLGQLPQQRDRRVRQWPTRMVRGRRRTAHLLATDEVGQSHGVPLPDDPRARRPRLRPARNVGLRRGTHPARFRGAARPHRRDLRVLGPPLRPARRRRTGSRPTPRLVVVEPLLAAAPRVPAPLRGLQPDAGLSPGPHRPDRRRPTHADDHRPGRQRPGRRLRRARVRVPGRRLRDARDRARRITRDQGRPWTYDGSRCSPATRASSSSTRSPSVGSGRPSTICFGHRPTRRRRPGDSPASRHLSHAAGKTNYETVELPSTT